MDIEPMLLSEVDDETILDKEWIYQQKFNGVRAIIHVKDHKIIGIRGRSGNPLLFCYPELKEIDMPMKSGILDAEIVVLKNGKDYFYGGVDQRRSVPSLSKLRDYPVTAIVFDAIQLNGEPLINVGYDKRLEKLEEFDWSGKKRWHLQLIESTPDGRQLWTRAKEENWEGIVCKNPLGTYELGVRSKQFLKLKNYKFVDVIVDKTEPNPKGTKIYAKAEIDGVIIDVSCQRAGAFNINVGDNVRVKYLDIVGDRLIQPTNW